MPGYLYRILCYLSIKVINANIQKRINFNGEANNNGSLLGMMGGTISKQASLTVGKTWNEA